MLSDLLKGLVLPVHATPSPVHIDIRFLELVGVLDQK
jgi:hypothetical protein